MPVPADADFDYSARSWSQVETSMIALLNVVRSLHGAGTGGNVEIAGGVLTPTGAYVRMEAEGGVADSVDSIDLSAFEDEAILILQPHGGEPEITITHTVGAGAGEFSLSDGQPFVMKSPQYFLAIRKSASGVASELFRWYGVLDDATAEFAAFLGLAEAGATGAQLITANGTWTATFTGDAILTGVGGGGGGGGGSDGATNAGNGGDGGDTTFSAPGPSVLATFPGGKGGGGGFANGRGGNPGGGGFGGQRGETYNAAFSMFALGGQAIPTSLGKFGRGGQGATAGVSNTGGGGASGSQTEEQTQVVSVTKGVVYTIAIGAGGTAGTAGGSSFAGLAGEDGALKIERAGL